MDGEDRECRAQLVSAIFEGYSITKRPRNRARSIFLDAPAERFRNRNRPAGLRATESLFFVRILPEVGRIQEERA